MNITDKLKLTKEILATSFTSATENAVASGLQFKYKSEPIGDKEGWKFTITVKQAGYPPKDIQEFKFQRPANVDAKTMEYNVLLHVISELTQTAMLSWYQLGIMLNKDQELQNKVLDK